jgi:hypothetical protein
MIVVRAFGFEQLTARLTALQREQLPFATALALTRTARIAKQGAYARMRQKFDRPTPFVMDGSAPGQEARDNYGSLRVMQATKTNLRARVWLKDTPFERQRIAMDPLLVQHFRGGPRVPKGLELWFRELGLIGPGEYLIPNKGARLNRYGNLSQGQYAQILSALQLRRSTGYANAPTDSRRSKKAQAEAGQIFWSAGPGGAKPLIDMATGIAYGHSGLGAGRKNNLPKGVWVRRGAKDLACILLVHRSAPKYKRVIDMQAIGEQASRQHFQDEFRKALRDALRTAGRLESATREQRVADWRTRAFR